MSSGRVAVDDAEAFDPGDRQVVTVDGSEVLVVNFNGSYYAVSNTCAHDGGALEEGYLNGKLVCEFNDPGERATERYSSDPAIACPLHGFEYELETGRHVGTDSFRLPTWDVVVDDGTVYIEM